MLTNLNKKLDYLDNIKGNKKTDLKKTKRRLLIIAIVLLIFLVLPLGLAGFFGKQAASSGKALVAGYKNQNFDEIKTNLSKTKNSLQAADMSLNLLFWMRLIPIIGGYYGDAKGFVSAGVHELRAAETIFSSLEPHKNELGFNNQPLPGQDRISQGIKILEKALPELSKVEGDFQKAADAVKGIDTNKYPENVKNIKLRQLLTTGKEFITGVYSGIQKAKPALELAPDALGITSPKTYLLLFQNDKEIRPTGGFISAYATLKIDKGQITTTASDDIYHLDERLLKTCLTKVCPLVPPAPITKYLPEENGKARTAWSMRDSNISPDVPTAAKEFERMYELLGDGLPFDGIIFIDTQVVEKLIAITGPIDILGTKYSAETDPRCNCPNVIYELETYVEIAAKGTADRKEILGTLMQQLLARALGSEIEKTPLFIQTAITLANHKHIVLYMHNQKLQESLASLGWTGVIKEFNGDYLHINDANFAGGKSNLYVEQTVTQEITVDKGKVKKKVTIEYKNPQKFNNWLNGINRDYMRLYVPKGSKLISSKGSEEGNMNTKEELGKTVFEAFITVRPQNSRKLEVEYEIPYQPGDKYDLLVQKQPGAKDFKYIIKLNGKKIFDSPLEADQEFHVSY